MKRNFLSATSMAEQSKRQFPLPARNDKFASRRPLQSSTKRTGLKTGHDQKLTDQFGDFLLELGLLERAALNLV
jgi:hypothetical protein